MNNDLFSKPDDHFQIEIEDGELHIYPHFYHSTVADEYFQILLQKIHWQQENIYLYGKKHKLPRLTAWYADNRKSYEYSGVYSKANPWISQLQDIKHKIEATGNIQLNSVLANQYRNGADGVAWHSDDEIELGNNPIIASISLGEERLFQLKHKTKTQLKKNFILPHGSLLIMGGAIQANWLHQIPKSQKTLKPRINLTFRYIY